MKSPYVSCIMPTKDRPNFVELSIQHFLNQDYRNVELIIVDDGIDSVRKVLPDHHRLKYFYTKPFKSLGLKRNFACERAQGEIIMHWDDDDYYEHDWISKQIMFLEKSGADICGLNKIVFFSPLVKRFWNYENKDEERPWLSGATLAYWKSFWQDHPFIDINVGEDYDYIWNTGAKIFAHDYSEGFIATLHNANTTLKPFENPKHKKNAIDTMDVTYKGKTENPEQSRYNYKI